MNVRRADRAKRQAVQRVAIVQPALPQYRLPFFERLTAAAAAAGVQIDVFYGQTPRELSDRGDTVHRPGCTPLPTRFLNIRGRDLIWKSLGPVRARGPYDLIIVEQAVRNLESYGLLVRRGGAKLAFWGHGTTYTVPIGRTQERVKNWLTRRGEWFFAYTAGGARAVASSGFPPERITVVQNAIDATALREAVDGVTAEERHAFERAHDLRGKTALFVGGLDAPKRIGFLLEAAKRAHALDPDFRLLVAGAGRERELVERASSSPWVISLGPVFGHEKAVALAASQVLAMPGRVGLVAVDGFAAGLPIVTTRWPWHAPEFEYLEHGRNAVVAPDDVQDYAQALVELLRQPDELQRLAHACRSAAAVYTVDAMVERFLSGILAALAGGAPR